MLFNLGIEQLPEIGILDRFFIRCLPAIALPAVNPLVDALQDVLRIGVNLPANRALQRLNGADGSHQLHAVVGGCFLATPEFFFFVPSAQDRSPAARAGVPLAGAIGENLYRFFNCHYFPFVPLGAALRRAPASFSSLG